MLYRTERESYHNHRSKARSHPDKYICIIVDGMDQAKTNLPYSRKVAKSTQSLRKLRTHLNGVLVHTRAPHGKQAHIFIDLLQWPHDVNLTVTSINRALLHYIANTSSASLPAVLYLQMDNTCRENKNKYLLGYCAFLVESRVFRKVCMATHHAIIFS